MKTNLKLCFCSLSVAVLTACGGGGGGSPSVNTAEGLWQGPSSTEATVTVAILKTVSHGVAPLLEIAL